MYRLCRITFSMAEDSVFEKYIKTKFNPEFKKISRKTCKSDSCKVYDKRKQILIAILSSLSYRITITFDCWECLNDNYYLYIIVNYIIILMMIGIYKNELLVLENSNFLILHKISHSI